MATDNSKDVHDIHPSLANLTGTIGLAKNRLSKATTDQDYKIKRVDTADNLKSGALRPFANSGERNFLILIDNIQLFNDKELTQLTTHITLEKDAIVSGTYLYNDNNVISIGNPYNVYCKALDVEPQDLIHSEYIENEHNNNIDSTDQDDFVVVDVNTQSNTTQNENVSTQPTDETLDITTTEITINSKPYDPQKMNTMRVISMDENDDETEQKESNKNDYSDPDITDAVLVAPVSNIHTIQPSVSAVIPEIDNDLTQNYPTTTIENIQEKNESFIGRLPAKQSAVVNTSNGLQFEAINENKKPKPASPDSKSNLTNKTINYHEQAVNNQSNVNYNVSTANDNGSPGQIQAKYLFNNFLIRALILSISLLIFCVLSFGEWFSSQLIKEFKTSYGIAAFGIFVIFLGSFGCLFGGVLEVLNVHIPNKRYFIWFIAVLYTLGGLFYFFGGCAVANAYNSLFSDIINNISAYSGVWWAEMFYVCVISIIFGIDIWKHFLDRWDVRVCVFLILYVFCGFILSICLLICNDIDGTFVTLGIGYLLSTICAFLFLVLRLLVVLTNKIKASSITELTLMIFLLIFILFIGFTYFALAGKNEINRASYYVGMGIFHILIGVFMTFDSTFCQYLIPILC